MKDNTMDLHKYFNRKCFGTFGSGYPSIFGAASAGVLLTSGVAPLLILGAATTAFTAGQINMWQKDATGKPIWEPKIGIFGI